MAGRQLSLQQRVARNVKMRNRQLEQGLPLLAAASAIPADWYVSPEAETQHLVEQQAAFEAWWAGLQALAAEQQARADRCRAECLARMDAAAFAEVERRASWFVGRPEYLADLWSRALARLDPSACPHGDHSIFAAGELCPVCGVVVANENL